MKIQTYFRVLRIFLPIFIVSFPVLVNSAELAQDIQKEITRQNLRITQNIK
jgi:hypothetical protein